MPAIDFSRNNSDALFQRRSVITSPEWRFSPPGSRWGGFNLTFSQIREISKKSPTVQSIISLRQNQVGGYLRTPRHKGDSGFEVVRADNPGKKTVHDERVIKFVMDFLTQTGAYNHPIRRPSLALWGKELVRDIYTIGAGTTELVYDEGGRLGEFWPVDAATIEIQWAERYIPTTRYGKNLDQPVRYVQVVDGQVMTEYADDELIYMMLSPVTDIANGGYPISAAEACIDWIAAEVLAMQYNSNFFDHGSVPPGILSLVGNYSEDTIQTLKTMWQTDVKGVVGQHKPVILATQQGQSIQWINMKQNNRDMEYAAFVEQLSNKICSVFGADPLEVGQRTASTTHGMAASDNTAVKLEAGRSKGLLPLLDLLEQTVNERIMLYLAPGYVFRFTGVGGEEDETQKVNYLNSQLNEGALTAREWRKAMGLDTESDGEEKIKEELWLAAPGNRSLAEIWRAQHGQELQPQGAGQPEMSGALGQPGMPPPQGQPGQEGPLPPGANALGKILAKEDMKNQQAGSNQSGNPHGKNQNRPKKKLTKNDEIRF